MTLSRYAKTGKFKNSLEQYEQIFDKKEVSYINQYISPENVFDKSKIDFAYEEYEWKPNDKLYKLAQRFYGDSKLWWIIAHINLRPTDSHYNPGDVVIIPNKNALDKVIKFLGY